MVKRIYNGIVKEVLHLVKHYDVKASCVYLGSLLDYSKMGLKENVLVIVGKLESGLSFRDTTEFSFLIVDERIFNADIERGLFGDFLTEYVIFPPRVIYGEQYLSLKSEIAKKRIIIDSLKDIVYEFTDASSEIFISPYYFFYDYLTKRARLYPFMRSRYMYLTRHQAAKEITTRSFEEILHTLVNDGILEKMDGGYYKISADFIEAVIKSRKNLLFAYKTLAQLRGHLLSYGFIGKLNFPTLRNFLRRVVNSARVTGEDQLKLIDPKSYLYIDTALGKVSLKNGTTLGDFISQYFSGEAGKFTLKRYGSFLNSVFVASSEKGDKVLIKKFNDLASFKWIPTSIYALGSRNFSVFAKTRMAKEYAFNILLKKNGIKVPSIIYANWSKRYIVEEFIGGDNFANLMKKHLKERICGDAILEIAEKIGRELAKIHRSNISLGDCNPHNIIVNKSGIYFVDLEQASKGKDFAWDIAEFLGFSAMQVGVTDPSDTYLDIMRSFLNGYVRENSLDVVREALRIKYLRLFTPVVLPTLLIKLLKMRQEFK